MQTGPHEIELGGLIDRFAAAVEQCALESPGHYRRWLSATEGRDLASNPYGCADAANLLYTIDRLPEREAEREHCVTALQSFQNAESGLFQESTHHPIHVTAHCAAALELFSARPAHSLAALAYVEEAGALEAFLDGLQWRDDPWLASHQGAGLYAARWLAGEANADWQARYFAWLDAECDPDTGLWRRGCLQPPYRWGQSRFPYLAGTFHYLFNYEHAGHAHPHPVALIDTCLSIRRAGDEWPLGRTVSFAEIDWVYCLTRALQQVDHRREEAREALESFATDYVTYLSGLDWTSDDGASDLHRLFGAACALAELQQALPHVLHSDVPLRLVLDRRPFI